MKDAIARKQIEELAKSFDKRIFTELNNSQLREYVERGISYELSPVKVQDRIAAANARITRILTHLGLEEKELPEVPKRTVLVKKAGKR